MLVSLRKKVLVYVSCILGVMFFFLLPLLVLGERSCVSWSYDEGSLCVSCLLGVMFFCLLR